MRRQQFAANRNGQIAMTKPITDKAEVAIE